MTLPRALLGLFPEEGEVLFVFPQEDEAAQPAPPPPASEFRGWMSHPRVVAGLGELYSALGLQVNDELLIRPVGERTFSLEALIRPEASAEAAERAESAGEAVTAEPLNLDPRAQPTGGGAASLPPGASAPSGGAASSGAASGGAASSGAASSGTTNTGPPGSEVRAAHPEAGAPLASLLRRYAEPLGFRVEPVGAGIALLHAELGRKQYRVLIQLLERNEKLDWAELLARRRETPADHVSVVGSANELARLKSPAELARTTLVSWEALRWLANVHASMPITPVELEALFAHGGPAGERLKRLEREVREREAERNRTTHLLTWLAALRAPAVFLLEEVAQDLELSREAVLGVLSRLSGPPLHLISRVGDGEFLLKESVDDALAALAVYAAEVRANLPTSRRVVVEGQADELATR